MVSSSKSALLTWHRQFDAQCPAQWHCRDTKASGRAGDYVPAARRSLPAGVVLHRRSCAFELRLLLAISGNQQKSSGLVRTVSRLRVHAPAPGERRRGTRCLSLCYTSEVRPRLGRTSGSAGTHLSRAQRLAPRRRVHAPLRMAPPQPILKYNRSPTNS